MIRSAALLLILCSATTAWSEFDVDITPPSFDGGVFTLPEADIKFDHETEINNIGLAIDTVIHLDKDGCEVECEVEVTSGEYLTCTSTLRCNSDWNLNMNNVDVEFQLDVQFDLDLGDDCNLSGSCCYDANGNLTGDFKLCVGDFTLNGDYDNGDIKLGGGIQCDGWECKIEVNPNGGDIFIGGQVTW